MSEYSKVDTHKNWAIWQRNGEPDLVGNMKLEHEIKGVDKPDLVADIDEAMNSNLGAFEAKITEGPKPTYTPPPAPTPLTASEKSSALRSIGYAESNLTYLMGQTSRNTDINTKVLGLRTSLATVKSDIIADPPLRRSSHGKVTRHTRSRHL